MIVVLGAVVLALAALALARTRCRHVDEDGHSLLVPTHYEGRMRGWCPECSRFTAGWPSQRF